LGGQERREIARVGDLLHPLVGRWFDNHKPKNKANLKLMTADFVALNNCPSHQMVVSKVAFDKMIEKWSTK
jgi:hypothetical protein